MKSMYFMSIFWKIHYDYKKTLYENKCKSQYKEYLKYLEKKTNYSTLYFYGNYFELK